MTIVNRPLIQSLIIPVFTCLFAFTSLQADDSENLKPINSDADSFEINPSINFDRSKPIYLDHSEITFKAKWADRYNQGRRSIAEKLNDDDLNELKQRTAKSINRGLTRAFKDAGYNLVDDKATASYIIQAKLTELEINAPDVSGGPHKEMRAHSAGEATIDLQLLTADGQVIAMMRDHRKTLEYTDLRLANRVFNDTEFRRMAERWAKTFISHID